MINKDITPEENTTPEGEAEVSTPVETEAPAENTRPSREQGEGGERPQREGGYNRGRGGPGAQRRRKKVCIYCTDKNETIDYKAAYKLKKFVTERGKILPRRVTGTCAAHQRAVTTAIKTARHMALMPYTSD